MLSLFFFFFVKSEICIPKLGSRVLLNTRVPSEVNLANVIKPEGTSRYKALTKKLKCSLRKWSVIEPREGWRRSKLSSHCGDDEILMFPPSWIQFTETSQEDEKKEKEIEICHHCTHCVCFKPLSEAIMESSKNSLHLLIATPSILHASGKKRGCSAAPPGPLLLLHT